MKFLIALFAFLQALSATVIWGTVAYFCWRALVILWHTSDSGILSHLSH